MRVLVTGAGGMLAQDLLPVLSQARHEVLAMSRSTFDISDPESAGRIAVGEFGELDAVINTAAYTAVDRAESDQEAAYAANALGPSYLATACSMSKVHLIHFGTDFVFDGKSSSPYREEDTTHPLGVYGQTKHEGELAVLESGGTVLRVGWLFGAGGKCFPEAILRRYLAGGELRVVTDQVGTPTPTALLAQVAAKLVGMMPQGLIHVPGPEAMSWHEFACRVVAAYHRLIPGAPPAPLIQAIKTEEWPSPAPRPAYSVLDGALARSLGLGLTSGSLEPALEQYVRDVAPRLTQISD